MVFFRRNAGRTKFSDVILDGTCLSPRAQHVLHQMGLLTTVAAQAHHAHQMSLHAPNGQQASARIAGVPPVPNRTLVLPRYTFDHVVQQAAIAAGAAFRVAHVSDVLREGQRVVGVRTGHGDHRAALVVLATGAATRVVQAADMLPQPPGISVAARQYYQTIPNLGTHLELFFNQVALPGYAWLFPTGPDRANVGVWYSGRWPLSARAALPTLARQHPGLAGRLAGAQPMGPVKSYPLRTDFLRAPKLRPGVLAVGEAAGLVNPFTGEGIDYALESAQLAAQAIIPALAAGPPSVSRLRPYEHALHQRFRALFVLMGLARRVYANPPVFNRIFGRTPPDQRTIDSLIQTCFGTANPARVVQPHVLRSLLKPLPAR